MLVWCIRSAARVIAPGSARASGSAAAGWGGSSGAATAAAVLARMSALGGVSGERWSHSAPAMTLGGAHAGGFGLLEHTLVRWLSLIDHVAAGARSVVSRVVRKDAPSSIVPRVAAFAAAAEHRRRMIVRSLRSALVTAPDSDIVFNAQRLVRVVCGFPMQVLHAVTADGYVLPLLRLPRPRSRKVALFQVSWCPLYWMAPLCALTRGPLCLCFCSPYRSTASWTAARPGFPTGRMARWPAGRTKRATTCSLATSAAATRTCCVHRGAHLAPLIQRRPALAPGGGTSG